MTRILERREPEKLTMSDSGMFSELMDKANAIQGQCIDYQANGRDLRISEDLMLRFVEGSTYYKKGINPYAFSQLCGKIGVPVRYMKKCLEEGMVDLVQNNLNAWLEDYDKNLLLRGYGNNIRGILSDRYSVLDTPDILKSLSDTIDPETFKIKSFLLNEERLHVRLIQNEMMNVPNEDLFAGLQIDSSDVGRNTLIVQFFVYKQVCSNGLVVAQSEGEIFRQKHIGISSDDFQRGLRENLDRVEPLVAKVTEMIETTRNVKIRPDQIEKMMKEIQESIKVGEDTAQKVIDIMNEKYDRTRWGLINSLTEVSQDFTLDRRLEIEKYAGSLLVA